MIPKLQVFEILTVNDELAKEFNDFFTKWDLLPLFTDEHRTGKIKVTDSDARAVTNHGGAYNKQLKEFSELMDYAQDNKSYQEALFKVLHGAKSFQKLMNNIKKVSRYVKNEIQTDRQHNRWNIVFYDKKLL